jgi:hypothetical protein
MRAAIIGMSYHSWPLFFLSLSSSPFSFFLALAISVGVQHLPEYRCSLAIRISSVLKCLSKTFAYFKIGFFSLSLVDL